LLKPIILFKMFTRLIKQTISFLVKPMPSDDEEVLKDEHLK